MNPRPCLLFYACKCLMELQVSPNQPKDTFLPRLGSVAKTALHWRHVLFRARANKRALSFVLR
jgi:hypothetical protein